MPILILAGLASVVASAGAIPQRPSQTSDSGPRFAHSASLPAVVAPIGKDLARKVSIMTMAPQLADNLALLFDKFGATEFVVCIEGGVDESGQLELRDFRMPHIAYSRATGTAVHPDGGCDQYEGIVGSLHNHPPKYPEDRAVEWTNCYLSRPDILSWLEHSSYPYTFVMCGQHFWAWWHRSQVDTSKVLAFPPTGQLNGRPPNLE